MIRRDVSEQEQLYRRRNRVQQESLYYYLKSLESALEQICDVAIDET